MTLILAEPPDLLRAASRMRRSLADAESNVAIDLSRLGCTARWIGVLGQDPLGDAAVTTLRGGRAWTCPSSVATRMPTGVLLRDAPVGRAVQVVYHRSAGAGAKLAAADVPPTAVAGARMVHVAGVTLALSPSCAAAAEALARHGKEAGAEVVLNPNHRSRLWSAADARAGVARLAELADVVLVGDDEGALLTGGQQPVEIAAWFLARGASLVVVKRGARGAWAFDGAEEWDAPGVDVAARRRGRRR